MATNSATDTRTATGLIATDIARHVGVTVTTTTSTVVASRAVALTRQPQRVNIPATQRPFATSETITETITPHGRRLPSTAAAQRDCRRSEPSCPCPLLRSQPLILALRFGGGAVS